MLCVHTKDQVPGEIAAAKRRGWKIVEQNEIGGGAYTQFADTREIGAERAKDGLDDVGIMLKPSLPRPTVTPARTSSSTGARPTALFMFERGLCTLLVRVWARRPISPLRICTQCAAILCGPRI